MPGGCALPPRGTVTLKGMEREQRTKALRVVKLLHTAVWAFMVGCIVLIPVAAAWREFLWAEVLTAFVLVECLVLAVNRGRCPLTDIAARYTDERAPNFDIYLPRWLAQHNKTLFGALFLIDILFLVRQFAS